MKVSFDEVFAGLAMSVMAYFSYRVLLGKGVTKVKKNKEPKAIPNPFKDMKCSSEKTMYYFSDTGNNTPEVGAKVDNRLDLWISNHPKRNSAFYEEHLKHQINKFSKKYAINSTYGKFSENASYESVPVH